MATGPGVSGGSNTYIPNFEASGRLAVNFTRNPKSFRIAEFIQYIQTPHRVGNYLKVYNRGNMRITAINDDYWAPGANAPTGNENLAEWEFKQFSTKRRATAFNLDEDAVDQGEWSISEYHAAALMQLVLTKRTYRVFSALTTTANWAQAQDLDASADHYNSASSLVGGYLDQGTSTAPYLRKAMTKIANLVLKDSGGVITDDNIMFVMNPNTASLISNSPEIHDYIKGSPAAKDEIYSGASPNAKYGAGLPSTLYGYKVIVDPTVYNSAAKGATLAKGFAFPDQTMVAVSRVGGLEAPFIKNTPNFSTMVMFWYRDEITVERFHDVNNRLYNHRIVEDTAEVLVSPATGYLITSATSAAS